MFMEITLDQLLASRDERYLRQQHLLQEYADRTLVSLTVIMPGKVKRNSLSLVVAQAATEAIREAFGEKRICHSEERDLPTGYEAFYIVDCEERHAKEIVCEIEERHPLGRLFDMDVIRHDGTPYPRTEVGLPQRRCLLCDNEARYCMRNHSHSQEEISAEIKRLVENYQKEQEQGN